MTYWRPVTLYQAFTNIIILAIIRHINGSFFVFVHLLAEISFTSRTHHVRNVREFLDNNNHKGAQSTVVERGPLISQQNTTFFRGPINDRISHGIDNKLNDT